LSSDPHHGIDRQFRSGRVAWPVVQEFEANHATRDVFHEDDFFGRLVARVLLTRVIELPGSSNQAVSV